ncbi:hypothetical protein BDW74DRAFT_164681 [Aspergillus multicolor]|uniref:uncharacterized protein n=1 Tax=Aspergillus multicolor TaxID=41759 RepID=UPI003CCDD387
MSGIEAAGLALAVLPLVVNQLDNYARGIETVKGLRRYRWELENYSSNLSAQYAIFLNTLEIFLQDVVDDHDERSELIKNPSGTGWKDPQLQAALRHELGRDYHAFTGTVAGLCSLLEELSNKLNRQTPDYLKACDSCAASFKLLGALKFRKILSKAVYEDILNRVDRANQILKTLTEQSHQLDQAAKAAPRWRKGLKRHRDGRRHARALYNILVQGQGWKCSCRDNHTVCFRLDANTVNNLRTGDQAKKTRFLMMLSAENRAYQTTSNRQWHEIELQPELVENIVPVSIKQASMSVSDGKRKVQFAASSTTVCVETVHKTPSLGPIGDLCSTLGSHSAASLQTQQDGIGYILNQAKDARYNMRLLRTTNEDLDLYSLQDMLSGLNPFGMSIKGSAELSRRDRLYLASVLACGVLQLHGAWLKQEWSTKDVLFARNAPHDPITFDHPCLLWPVSGSCTCSGITPSTSAKIQNEILLPLAVALIELSLGKTIATLYRVDDHDPVESQMHFNTATRVLRNVYYESGSNYGDVVRECLYWSRNKGERFEDPQFDESVFDTIVSPLLKDLTILMEFHRCDSLRLSSNGCPRFQHPKTPYVATANESSKSM